MPENRLARETSPYLIQHKDNPVAWWPWGPEALAEANRTGKPILLSVGYAACHWCHVMAHESFEDPATASVMNELFVNIKVDREERPEIDEIYMNALHLLGEQGGWPLTMFLTPQGEPVWGGTYFPKDSRYGRPAFVDVLREVSRVFREEPEKIDNNRKAIVARLADRARAAGKANLGRAELDQIATRFGNLFELDAWRHPRCAKVPAVLDPRASLASRRTNRGWPLFRDCRPHPRTHEPGRNLRSSRRRVLSILSRRALARAALREDALRQRPTARTAGARPCPHRKRPVPRTGDRNCRLALPAR